MAQLALSSSEQRMSCTKQLSHYSCHQREPTFVWISQIYFVDWFKIHVYINIWLHIKSYTVCIYIYIIHTYTVDICSFLSKNCHQRVRRGPQTKPWREQSLSQRHPRPVGKANCRQLSRALPRRSRVPKFGGLFWGTELNKVVKWCIHIRPWWFLLNRWPWFFLLLYC